MTDSAEVNYPKVAADFSRLLHDISQLKKEVFFATRRFFWEQDKWLFNARNSHAGERCFLVGTGPSLKQTDLTLLKDEWVMACNGAFLLKELHIDYFITVSHYFYKSHLEEMRALRCKQRFLPYYLKDLDSEQETSWLNSIEKPDYASHSALSPYSFSFDPSHYIYLGGTVIFPALQILHFLGFSEVYLLGVDHNYGIPEDDKNNVIVSSDHLNAHFTDNYYTQATQVHVDFPAMNRGYTLARDVFRKSDKVLKNATPGTKLDIIDKVNYTSLFE